MARHTAMAGHITADTAIGYTVIKHWVEIPRGTAGQDQTSDLSHLILMP